MEISVGNFCTGFLQAEVLTTWNPMNMGECLASENLHVIIPTIIPIWNVDVQMDMWQKQQRLKWNLGIPVVNNL